MADYVPDIDQLPYPGSLPTPFPVVLRGHDGQEVAFVDFQDRPLYSTADFLNGWSDEEVEFFQYRKGERVAGTSNITTSRTATERDTNIAVKGQMSGTQEGFVFSIQPEIFLFNTDAEDPVNATTWTVDGSIGLPFPRAVHLATLAAFCTMKLTTAKQVVHQVGFGMHNTGAGAVTFGSYSGGSLVEAERSLGNQGVPGHGSVRSFAVPFHIAQNATFSVTLQNPTGRTINWLDESDSPAPSAIENALIQIRVNLGGFFKRGVTGGT